MHGHAYTLSYISKALDVLCMLVMQQGSSPQPAASDLAPHAGLHGPEPSTPGSSRLSGPSPSSLDLAHAMVYSGRLVQLARHQLEAERDLPSVAGALLALSRLPAAMGPAALAVPFLQRLRDATYFYSFSDAHARDLVAILHAMAKLQAWTKVDKAAGMEQVRVRGKMLQALALKVNDLSLEDAVTLAQAMARMRVAGYWFLLRGTSTRVVELAQGAAAPGAPGSGSGLTVDQAARLSWAYGTLVELAWQRQQQQQQEQHANGWQQAQAGVASPAAVARHAEAAGDMSGRRPLHRSPPATVVAAAPLGGRSQRSDEPAMPLPGPGDAAAGRRSSKGVRDVREAASDLGALLVVLATVVCRSLSSVAPLDLVKLAGGFAAMDKDARQTKSFLRQLVPHLLRHLRAGSLDVHAIADLVRAYRQSGVDEPGLMSAIAEEVVRRASEFDMPGSARCVVELVAVFGRSEPPLWAVLEDSVRQHAACYRLAQLEALLVALNEVGADEPLLALVRQAASQQREAQSGLAKDGRLWHMP